MSVDFFSSSFSYLGAALEYSLPSTVAIMKSPLTGRHGFKLPVSFSSFPSLRYLFYFSLVMISSSCRKTCSSANECTQHRKQKYGKREVNQPLEAVAPKRWRATRDFAHGPLTLWAVFQIPTLCRPPMRQGGRARRHRRQIPWIHTALPTSHSKLFLKKRNLEKTWLPFSPFGSLSQSVEKTFGELSLI